MAATDVTQPKTPRSHFGAATCETLQTLCDVHREEDLPPVWAQLAAAGKKDRLALEQAIMARARELGMAEQCPVVTPDLTKKVVSLNWAGTNLDDLSEGIQPFALVLPEYSGSDARTQAPRQAEVYDILASSDATATLNDAKALKSSSAVILTDYIEARAHLAGSMIVWSVLVGDGHPFVVSLGKMIQQYTSREHFYQNQLMALHQHS